MDSLDAVDVIEPIQLETIRDDVWRWLSSALVERDHPMRTPALATVDADGSPRARVVVLRSVEAEASILEFHTDTRSPKFASLRERPAVAWLFYDSRTLLQVRAEGSATLHTDDAMADASWAKTNLASRVPYMAAVPSGEVVESVAPGVRVRDDEHSGQGRPFFCAVRCVIRRLDVVQLHPDGHRRIEVVEAGARWLAP